MSHSLARKEPAHWEGPYLIQPPKPRPAKGMQMADAHIPSRKASCEEVLCEYFLLGKTGADAGFPFTHPAGVECGDFKGCNPCEHVIREVGANGVPTVRLCGYCMPCKAGTANCPCAERLTHHRIADERFSVRFHVATPEANREVVPDEYMQRTGEGMETLHHIKTRGI